MTFHPIIAGPLLTGLLLTAAAPKARAQLTQVIASGGGVLTGANGSLSYTVGETAVGTIAGTTTTLTIGFQQPLASSNPLPLNFLSFTATLRDGQTQLEWVTAQEVNTDSFEVQRSADGATFATILTVKADHNAATQNTYQAVDTDPAKPIDYYRLKEIDINGFVTYSPIAIVRFDAALTAMVFPNPASSEVYVQLQSPTAKQAAIGLYDTRGQLMLSKEVRLAAGANQFTLAIEGLAPGLYYVRIAGLPAFTIMKQ